MAHSKDKWIETKTKPRLWEFKYTEILRKKPKKMRGKVRAVQYAKKVNANRYDLVMKGRRY